MTIEPNQLRWDAPPLEHSECDFIAGLNVVCGAGDPALKEGLTIYNYVANTSMVNKAFYNSDGDFLIVPQHGVLYIRTELGDLQVEPCEIVVIPRGIKFAVLVNGLVRGYVIETFKGHFELPGLGPIGSNGLANPRDFQTPVARFDDHQDTTHYQIGNKFMNKLFVATLEHSPFDVVAWHGNYVPFKYDLRKFNCMNTVTYDHPDPSIYTVLTCPTADPGVALIDFVIFPPRWMVAEHTFRLVID